MKPLPEAALPAVQRVHLPDPEPQPIPPDHARLRPVALQIQYTETRVRPDALACVQRTRGVAALTGISVTAGAGDALAETFRMLRTQVLLRLRRDGQRVLALTSARAMEGAALTAVNLALALAADLDTAVLLVDADLRKRRVQHLFGLDAEPGLADHLLHGAPLPDLLVNPGIDRLVLLPAGRQPVPHSAELLGARTLQHRVQELKARYADRVVLVHLPPLLDTADALAFLPQVDSTLLVVEASRTRLDDVERCAELLAPFGLMGTVMAPRERGGWRGGAGENR